MKKWLFILLFCLGLILLTGCDATLLPPEGSKCTWYINDQYDERNENGDIINTNALYKQIAPYLDLEQNPRIVFEYNNPKDYSINILGLKPDTHLEVNDNLATQGKFQFVVGYPTLEFSFSENYIKNSEVSGTCPYPTLYYISHPANNFLYQFSTGFIDNPPGYINIYNSMTTAPLPGDDEPDPIPSPEPNWCSTYFEILNTINPAYDATIILYFWENDDKKIMFYPQKIDENITKENLKNFSTFSKSYAWQSEKEELIFYDDLNGSMESIYVSFSVEGEAKIGDDGKIVCPGEVIVESTSASTIGEYNRETINSYNLLSGEEYRKLVCELHKPFNENTYADYNIIIDNAVTVDGKKRIDFSSCSGSYVSQNLEYDTSLALRNLGNYCNDLYSKYNKLKNQDPNNITKRMDECIDFDIFYNYLVKKGVVNNLGSDCPFISGALKEKIVWVFNLIKIAGPILAIGLGSIDFIKVIVSGEADKEMKKAGQSFLKRFIAAVLLFIIPIILAWAIDLIFETGGFKDNPFCNTVDWSKIK